MEELKEKIIDVIENGRIVDWRNGPSGQLADQIISLIAEKDAGANVPLDRLVMPRALTAENGAKGLLMGEFSEEIELSCPDCDGGTYHDLPTDQCGTCNDTGLITSKVDISWTTIKDIYAMAVKHLGA